MSNFTFILKQFIRFGLVGVSNTLISLGVYYLLYFLGVHYLIANTIGFIISVFNAYYWNNKYVFKKTQDAHLKPFMKTFFSLRHNFFAIYRFAVYLGSICRSF